MTWYRAGTITAAIGSTSVTGAATLFNDPAVGINPGDSLIVGVGASLRIYEIASVNSATSLTLATATMLAFTNTGYQIQTSVALTNQSLAKKIAATMDRVLGDIANWQSILTGKGNVTITAPDGTTHTGPSWGYLAGKLDGKLSTDSTTLRKLFTSAFVNPEDNRSYPGVSTYNNNQWGSPSQWGTVLTLSNHDVTGSGAPGRWFSYIQIDTAGNFAVSANVNNQFIGTYRVWTTKNTTVDGSGFIKRASPIVRLTSNTENMDEEFTNNFNIAGSAAVNEEAEGVTVENLGGGNYRISGSDGLAKDGWQVEVPKDINGNRLCFVKVTEAIDGILVKLFKPRLDIATGGIEAGEEFDIPDGRWVDVRLEMPSNSTYNSKQQNIARQLNNQQSQESGS